MCSVYSVYVCTCDRVRYVHSGSAIALCVVCSTVYVCTCDRVRYVHCSVCSVSVCRPPSLPSTRRPQREPVSRVYSATGEQRLSSGGLTITARETRVRVTFDIRQPTSVRIWPALKAAPPTHSPTPPRPSELPSAPRPAAADAWVRPAAADARFTADGL